MKVRATTPLALLLASALVAPVAEAQSFQYAPGTARYKIVLQQKMTQEAMGQKNEMDVNGEQHVSITLGKKAADTLTVNVSLDSIAMTNSMMGAMDMSRAKGIKVSSLISPTGVVYSTTVPDSGMAADVGDDLARMLPRITRSLAMGATWVDTLTGKVKRGGIDMERTIVTNSKVVGDTTIDGQKAWKIERASESKMSGSGSTQGQPVTMEGTSKGNGFLYVSPAGTFIGADSKDDVTMKITMLANGMEIAMQMANTSKVSKIQ